MKDGNLSKDGSAHPRQGSAEGARKSNASPSAAPISSLKSETARQNGSKSKGPKTLRGKNISRCNSLKHGAYAQSLLILEAKQLPGYADYETLLKELLEELSPSCLEDQLMIEKHVMDVWRLRRAFRFELNTSEVKYDGMGSPLMPDLVRYCAMVHRQWSESHQRLCEIRERIEREADAEALGEDSPESPVAEPLEEQDSPGNALMNDETTAGNTSDALPTMEEQSKAGPSAPVAKQPGPESVPLNPNQGKEIA